MMSSCIIIIIREGFILCQKYVISVAKEKPEKRLRFLKMRIIRHGAQVLIVDDPLLDADDSLGYAELSASFSDGLDRSALSADRSLLSPPPRGPRPAHTQ